MTIGIVRSFWSGTSGGPGLTQIGFYASGGSDPTATNAQSAVNAVRAFWNALNGLLPNEVTIQVQPQVDLYDEVSAALTGTVTAATPPASVTGTSAGSYAGGVGLKVDWNTGVILGGRRVVGRTYIVPAAASVFEADGTIAAGSVASVTTAAQTMLSSFSTGGLNMAVWTKPGGVSSVPGMTAITGASVKDKSAILRGRRD